MPDQMAAMQGDYDFEDFELVLPQHAYREGFAIPRFSSAPGADVAPSPVASSHSDKSAMWATEGLR